MKALGGLDSQIIYFPQWAEALYSNKPDLDFNDPLIPLSGFKIMFAGNIGSSQDFETIVAAALLLRDHKEITFLIVGDGLMKKWAQDEDEKNKLNDHFIFLGRKPVEMMPNYYSKADAMLMSLTDTDLFSITLPAKLQSYLASGKPILASMNGEGAEIVREWKAGMACPATNPKLLAETILSMSKLSKEELAEMGKNAFKCYQSEFEREKLISFLEDEFKKIT